MISLAHIVNPVIVPPPSDLNAAQPVTFATMKLAKEFAESRAEVRLYSAQFPEDGALVPPHLEPTPDLTRSVLDVASFRHPRKLPLIADILDRLYEASEGADALIYTNVDISLMPHFYVAVADLLESGRDAFMINRRTISDDRESVDDLPRMFSELGREHPGRDCFVFRRELYPRFVLGTACIGAPDWGRLLHANMLRFATTLEWRKHDHLTFHIGADHPWRRGRFADYLAHNRSQLRTVVAKFLEDLPHDHPLAGWPMPEVTPWKRRTIAHRAMANVRNPARLARRARGSRSKDDA